MKKIILIFIIILILLRLLTISLSYDHIREKSKYDFDNYQKVSKTFLGQDIKITQRSWQYPPIYSIIIIPTLFFDTTNYLLLLEIVFSVVSFYFLFLFIGIFKLVSDIEALLISFIGISLDTSYTMFRVGMPVSFTTMLFIIFIYYLYTGKKNNWYASLLFIILLLTKYLFVLLIPFIIYWLIIRYKKHSAKRILIFFIPSLICLFAWLFYNMSNYGFNLVGAIGGYTHIPINLYSNRFIQLCTNLEMFSIMILYLFFILSYLILVFYGKNIHTTKIYNYYLHFGFLIMIYAILLFFIVGYLLQYPEINLRYILYQTPIIFALSFINVMLINKILTKKVSMETKYNIYIYIYLDQTFI